MNNRLRELREARGWSQGALAEQLEVSRQTINALETGKYDPSLPLAFRIARMAATRGGVEGDGLSRGYFGLFVKPFPLAPSLFRTGRGGPFQMGGQRGWIRSQAFPYRSSNTATVP